MKDYKKMAAYCKELGLEFLRFDKRGHAVYGDPLVPQFVFTDSAPHNKHISVDYYTEAKRVSNAIKNHILEHGEAMIESFQAGPPSYRMTYRFNAAHSICSRTEDGDQYEYHQVSVLEIPSAIGTGDILEEAAAAASEALACAIERLQGCSDTIPFPQTVDQVRIKAEAMAANKHPWLEETVRFINVVPLKPAKLLAEKTAEEIKALEVEGRQIWDEVCRGL